MKTSFSQYWSKDSVPEYFLLDSIYNTNTLIVDTVLYEHLDHAISLIDSIDVQKDSTWLYFVISINSFYDNNLGKAIGIFLQQGSPEKNTVSQLIQYPGFEVALQGAFVYKGYVFFVHYRKENTYLFNKLFTKGNLRKFNFYYYKLYYLNEYYKLNNIPIQMGLKLFYSTNLNYHYTLKM